MVKSRLQDGTEPAIFIHEDDISLMHYTGMIAFGVLSLVFDWIIAIETL